MSATDGDIALACMSLFVDELARAGIAGACVSPGSRSTPIALALARHPRADLHVHLDERSAGFFALGLAKSSRRPAVVACTSGTAAANLLPAVVEAAQAGVPMIVLTADRPSELRGTGANQTIDQIELFGDYASFVEAGVPEAREGSARYWRSLGARAVVSALGSPARPVHLNLPFREPLVPTGASVDLGPDGAGRPDGMPWERASGVDWPPSRADAEDLARVIDGTRRGVILAGALDVEASGMLELARSMRWPLLAEPASGLRRAPAISTTQHLLADEKFARMHIPEVALQIGAAPTHRATLSFAAAAKKLVIVDPDGRRPDPARHAAWTIRAEPEMLARALLERVTSPSGEAWEAEWRADDDAVRGAINELLDSWDEPFEGRVARDVYSWLPDGSTLLVASSMPVRDLDAYAAPREGVRVLANRGASGIDGFVSTVLGVAATGVPTFALTGDLSLLHDAGALLWGARRGQRAVIVVVNNDGGGIFDLLPQVSLPEHERLFVTPHGLDLGALARTAGASYERSDRAADLLPALAHMADQPGVSILEVPVDRAHAVARREAVRAAVRSVVGDSSRARRRLERASLR